MSADYTKKKNAELEDLLKSRSLPHTGKKAELVARLQQYDADQAASKPTTTAATAVGEDEIDWEDDAAAATDPTSAATIAAGGLAQPANPTAVPNQKTDTDPSKASDLTVNPPAPETTTTAAKDNTKASTEPPAPKPDLSANLPTTTLDSELAKRRARAARFGIKESDSDALKAIERAKKFGTGDAGDRAAVKGLDEALPERGVKRGRGRDEREGGERGGRGEKRSKVREGRVRRARSRTPREGKGPSGSGLGEKDRLAAEARKAKFAQKA